MKKNRLKVENIEHEHKWQHIETVIHDDGNEYHCHHYQCTGRGCKSYLGINLSTPKVTSHKWEE